MADTRFKKGHKPWHTGLKGALKANSGSFKKGQSPPIHKLGCKCFRCSDIIISTMKGKKHNQTTKLKMSLAHKGVLTWNKGLSKYTDERLKQQSDFYKRYWSENPEKHPNIIMAQKGFISKPQKELYSNVLNKFSDAELEYPLKTTNGIKFIDIAVPSKKIAFEFDGEYWHQDQKDYDIIREKTIIAEGWIVIRFNYSNLNKSKEIIGELCQRC